MKFISYKCVIARADRSKGLQIKANIKPGEVTKNYCTKIITKY